MKNISRTLLASVCAGLTLPVAADQQWLVQPRAYVGVADYSLESNNDFKVKTTDSGLPLGLDAASGPKISDTMPIVGIGASVINGRFFTDLYYQRTVSGEASGSCHGNKYDSTCAKASDIDLDHDDWGVTVGYALNDQFTVFGGYKSGETDWEQEMERTQGSDVTNRGTFDQDGPFIGASYGFKTEHGALTAKLAVGDLDGELKVDHQYVETGNYQSRADLSGDTTGLSFGLAWTGSINESTSYSLGLNYYSYDFDVDGDYSDIDTAGGATQVVEGSVTEEFLVGTASILVAF